MSFSPNITELDIAIIISANTVEQQIFVCMKFSRISGDSRKFPAREYYLNKLESIPYSSLIGMSYTVGKLLISAFLWRYFILHTINIFSWHQTIMFYSSGPILVPLEIIAVVCQRPGISSCKDL